MSARSPRNVIVAKGNGRHSLRILRALPNGCAFRSVVTLRLRSACLYVSLPRGKERDREGT